MASNPAPERAEIVILGGGLAGLTASLFTGAPVFEADARPGGVASSDTVDGFTFDRGIHVLQTNNQEILKLLDDLGVEFGIRDRSAHIYAFRKYCAYPFQINSTNLPLARRISCVWKYLRREANPEPTNYEGWIYRTIGRGFGDTFLIPYSEKFWGVHPREMSFEWTGNRVPTSNVWQVMRGAIVSRNTRVGTNATFRYPKGAGGYGTVGEAIRRRVGDNVHTDRRALKIDTRQRRVFFKDSAVDYSVLLSTIPLPDLLRIAEAPREVRSQAAALQTNHIMVVNLGIARSNISAKHWIHFPEKHISFFRISFPHNFSEGLTPRDTSSVSAEVAYPAGSPPDRQELIRRVIDDLVKVQVLRPDDQIIVKHTYDIPYGYCIFNDARQRALTSIKAWLDEVDIVPGGRYGLWTYFWSDEAIVSGKESGELAKRRLGDLKASQARTGSSA
jgi:protoporphyrinogen oxidase